MIQIPHKCINYTPNDNLNKTCNNKSRCKIYYDEFCNDFEEKQEIYCDGIDCAWCTEVCERTK